MIELRQPGSGKTIRVADEHADTWRAAGYRDAGPGSAATAIDDMTKAELLDEAERRGIEVASSWTKAEIIQAIR